MAEGVPTCLRNLRPSICSARCKTMSQNVTQHAHTYRMIYRLDQNGFICCVFSAESKPLIVVAIYLSPRTPEVACPEPHTPVPICQSDRSKCQHYARQGSLSQYPGGLLRTISKNADKQVKAFCRKHLLCPLPFVKEG